jgi:myo-inositol-1(or 4)-monophosphatase
MPYLSPALNVMVTAARKVGRKLIRDYNEIEHLQVSMKGPADFVTNADKRTETQLVEELQKARPGYCFITEEHGPIDGPDKSHRFIIDPIDGTLNFMHGIPHFALSIGLERDGQLVSGVIYNPVTDEMYVAEKGGGAYLNDKRLCFATRKKLNEVVLATGIPFLGKPGHENFTKELTAVMATVAGVRRFGAASLDLAYVAAGRFDGYWERGLNSWDVAAGILLVREAGGMVTDMNGGPDSLHSGHILAANEHLHGPVLKLLKDAAKG